MEYLSAITETHRQQVTVEIRPWFADHSFAGQVILPAVESMAILALSAKGFRPELPVIAMKNGRFDKFLAIDPQQGSLTAFVELAEYANGDIGATLFTKTHLASMARVKAHGSITFAGGLTPPGAGRPIGEEELQGPPFIVSAESIYRELVPFGPAYRNITGTLRLSAEGGQTMVQAPELTGANQGAALLGSPFPLDAAFHAACAWSQRYQGVVAFPVGFAEREIRQATRPGGRYAVYCKAAGRAGELLLFDLEIREAGGTLCERVSGLRMRDVSGGRLKPPDWIRAGLPGN